MTIKYPMDFFGHPQVNSLSDITNSKKIGINGKIGVWIHNFLSNRQQCVAVNGATSSERQVRSGGPKGSVLGPLQFIIHKLYLI